MTTDSQLDQDGSADDAEAERGYRDAITLPRVANAVGIILLIAIVVPFAIFMFPQLVGGSQSFVVLSGSMEPAMSPGDAIIIEDVDPADIGQGDVITFARESESRPTTHRVETVIEQEDSRLFVTKGDANEEADKAEVGAAQIEGRVMSVGGHLFVIPYIGYVIEFAQTQTGFVVLFVLPIGLFLANELYNFVTGGGGTQQSGSETQQSGSVVPADSDADEAVGAASATDAALDAEGSADDAVAGGAAASTSVQDEEAESTYSLDPAEFRMGVLVLVIFSVYSVFVASRLMEPWTVGSAAAVVMATLLFGGLYVFGEPADADEASAEDTSARPGASSDTAPVDSTLETEAAEGGESADSAPGPQAVDARDGGDGGRESDSIPAFTDVAEASDGTESTTADVAGEDAEDSSVRTPAGQPATPAWVDEASIHPSNTTATNPAIHEDEVTGDDSDDAAAAREGDVATGATDRNADRESTPIGNRVYEYDDQRSGGETDD